MDGMTDHHDVEETTRFVYGETFARYDTAAFLAFLRPLEVRLAKNGIPKDTFRNARCLDAGCGSGRGTVLMARAGAREVVAFDLADQNLRTTRSHCRTFSLENVTTQQGSLLELPFDDASFDVVWCNGVLHHTTNPDKALQEIARVLRPGGNLWLYLYGSGGIYWHMVDFIRAWLRDIGPESCLFELEAMGYPVDRVAELLDDWFVPMLKRYTHDDVVARLAELGFGEVRYLKHGMSYDTSQRRGDGQENRWMGAGDLRYWATKSSNARASSHPLPDVDAKGSAFEDHEDVIAFDTLFHQLADAAEAYACGDTGTHRTARIRAAAKIQTRLRDLFTESRPFDAGAFRACIREQILAMPASLFPPP
jgi:ubiquinone/menaquinone biosynthesis C-methylase UbiE